MTKFLVASHITELVYKIPEGLDLEDESVEEYGIKWNILCVRRKGEAFAEQYDLKQVEEYEPGWERPHELEIKSKCDLCEGHGEEEEEEEEEED